MGPERERLQLLLTRSLCRRPLAEVVEAALRGGVDLVQVREKEGGRAARRAVVEAVLEIAAPLGVPVLIDDDVELARVLRDRVAGVHLGQRDLPVEEARRILGERAWIGLSLHCEQDLERARSSSATHFGLGSCFPSATKRDATAIARDELARTARRATRPLFAIGGITPENLPELLALGVSRVAVSSAILASDDPQAQSARFAKILRARA